MKMQDKGTIRTQYILMPCGILIQALLLTTALQCVTFAGASEWTEWVSTGRTDTTILNVLLYAVVLACIAGITRRLSPGYLATGILTGIWGVANNMKWNALNECIVLSDFGKLSEAVKVAKDAEFTWGAASWIGVGLFAGTLCLWIFTDRFMMKPHTGERRFRRYCALLPLIFFALLVPAEWVNCSRTQTETLTGGTDAKQTGPFAYFVQSVLLQKQLQAYTYEEAEASYEAYVRTGRELLAKADASDTEDTQTPNIIVIMSEAFYDLNLFEGAVSYSEDPMEAFQSVAEEGLTGSLYVNVYGGSTHFTEFEFLTGWNTRGMGTGSCPYKEYFSEKQPSYVRYLRDLQYQTVAIHPYSGTFWNRYVAYPRLGFEKFIDIYRMTYTEKCGYVSDESLTKEIILQYEERDPERPLFCFAVSIANHIALLNGEEKENAPDDIDVTYDDALGYGPNKKRYIREYVSGIAKSGEALRDLTEYLKTQDDPTIVVFFGDHAPSYALEQLAVAGQDETLAYRTPYLIWGNYDWQKGIEEQENISASYLSTYLTQLLHMPLTDQNAYNTALHALYPIETRYIIQDADGKRYADFSDEEKSAYYEHALDLKKHVETMLRTPDKTMGIWSAD